MMERLTTDKPVAEMGMYELAHNSCYIDENRSARYRDFETDIDIRELARDIMREFGIWEIDDDEMLSDEVFDETILEYLGWGSKEYEGLVALFYRNLWAMAELRERLKHYEDLEEQGLLLKLPCKEGDTVYTVSSYMECCREECKWLEEECEECWDYQRVYFVKETNFQIQMIALFGKTAFLTKEEAEAKLEELQNETHNGK